MATNTELLQSITLGIGRLIHEHEELAGTYLEEFTHILGRIDEYVYDCIDLIEDAQEANS